jgi:serine/threonine protein kinase
MLTILRKFCKKQKIKQDQVFDNRTGVIMKAGDVFDNKYRIISELGRGGMGAVYLAENLKLGTRWAIKEIDKSCHTKLDFFVESNILKKLNHPSLPRIFDIIEDHNYVYIIVDYIEGKALDKILSETSAISEDIVIEYAKQICDVYIYLHTYTPNPIIYRDMKPANIIITKEGTLKLIDFGIAREFKKDSESDTIYIGTRGFAAPEQYGSGQTNAATDIYSLGVTLYNLLTGKNPNDPPYELVPLRSIDRNISKAMETIVEKCTRQNPLERYQSAKELLFDLNNISNSEKQNKSILKNDPDKYRVPDDYKKVAGFAGSPSSGVTTTIIALSEYFVGVGKKVAIVDFTENKRLYEMYGWGYSKTHLKDADLCSNSLKYLLEGNLKPLKINKGLDLYISDSHIDIYRDKYIDIIDALRSENDIVFLDMDYNTDVELIKHINHLYIVKDMNMYNMKDSSNYINKLISASINLYKIKIIINKYIKCQVKPPSVVDTITSTDIGSIDGEFEMFINERPEYFVIPFEIENYRESILNINFPCFSCKEFSESFKESIILIGKSFYPIKEEFSLIEYIKNTFSK